MPPRPSHMSLTSSFGSVLSRVALRALAQASLVLVACMIMGASSGRGVAPYLSAAIFGFGLIGGFALNCGLRAEKNSLHDLAGFLYAFTLVSFFTAYASMLAHRLIATPGGF
jgi:hypothetical protein